MFYVVYYKNCLTKGEGVISIPGPFSHTFENNIHKTAYLQFTFNAESAKIHKVKMKHI